MALPKLDHAIFTHFLVGLNRKIQYRAFTVREQKILLHAKQSEDPQQIIDAMKQIVNQCILDEDIDVTDLPFFDLEDMFMRIRAKSVSEYCEIGYKDKETDKSIKVKINIDDVKVQTTEGHSSTIMLTDILGVKMRYPNIDDITSNMQNDDLLLRCIDCVFDEEQVYKLADEPREEVEQWIDDLGIEEQKKLYEFFETTPRLRYEHKIKLGDYEETLVFEGLEDFFT